MKIKRWRRRCCLLTEAGLQALVSLMKLGSIKHEGMNADARTVQQTPHRDAVSSFSAFYQL